MPHGWGILQGALNVVSSAVLPVSYTHLDVYKRQVAGLLYLVLALLFKLVGAKKVMRFFPPIVTGPVSYTHLDVYKRQGVHCPMAK